MIFRFQNCCLRETFDRWTQDTRLEKQLESKRRRVVSKLVNRCVSDAFEQWFKHVKGKKALEHKANSVMYKVMNRCVTETFNLWALNFRGKKALALKKLCIISKIIHSFFRTWLHIIKAERALESKKLRVISKIVNRCESESFVVWAKHISDKRRMDKKSTAVIFKILYRCLVETFNLWIDNAHHQSTVRRRIQDIVGASQQVVTNRVLFAWSEEVIRHKTLLRKILALVASVELRILRWGLLTWYQDGIQQNLEESKVGKLLIAWSRQREYTAFHIWHVNARTQHDTRERFQMMMGANDSARMSTTFVQWLSAAHKQQMLIRKTAKIVGSTFARVGKWTLLTWRENVLEVRGLEVTKRRIISRILHRSVCELFDSWNRQMKERRSRCLFIELYSQSHLGSHFRILFQSSKLKAPTSLFTETWQKRRSSFELSTFENVTPSGIGCAIDVHACMYL